jgi:hypothetical protein
MCDEPQDRRRDQRPGRFLSARQSTAPVDPLIMGGVAIVALVVLAVY